MFLIPEVTFSLDTPVGGLVVGGGLLLQLLIKAHCGHLVVDGGELELVFRIRGSVLHCQTFVFVHLRLKISQEISTKVTRLALCLKPGEVLVPSVTSPRADFQSCMAQRAGVF